MALIIPPETMRVLNDQAGALVALAYAACEDAVDARGANPEEIAQARAVQTVIYAVTAILQSQPLNEFGVLVAMGAVSGTVLGQCDGDRKQLYAMFGRQMAASLAEVAAARLPAQGSA